MKGYELMNDVRRLVILVFGLTVLIIGLVLLFIPGPGIPVIVFGLIILALEFVWARRILRKFKGKVSLLRFK